MPQTPIVGERNSRNIQSLLMPTVIPPQENNDKPGVRKCNKKCVTCREHLVETKEFKSATTGEIHPINQELSCDTENIIYLLHCDKCDNSQYIGETRNSLKKRLALHRSHIKYNTGTPLTQHFNLRDHNLQNLKAFPIQKILTDDHNHRKETESKWINSVRSRTPNGLNLRK